MWCKDTKMVVFNNIFAVFLNFLRSVTWKKFSQNLNKDSFVFTKYQVLFWYTWKNMRRKENEKQININFDGFNTDLKHANDRNANYANKRKFKSNLRL